MPGSNARALDKAKTLPADGLILDLEDAVAPDAKEAARNGIEMDLQAGLTLEKTLFSLLMSTSDRAEAALAFKEKRAPRFTGT